MKGLEIWFRGDLVKLDGTSQFVHGCEFHNGAYQNKRWCIKQEKMVFGLPVVISERYILNFLKGQ